MKIIIIRHPQTRANEKKIIYGKQHFPYTSLGQNQVKSVLKYFNETTMHGQVKIFSSSAKRTMDLAQPIAKDLGEKLHVDERLGEMNFGVFEGLTHQQAQATYPKAYDDFVQRFDTTKIPEGESYSEFQGRVHEFTDMLLALDASNAVDTSIVITHGAVIRDLLERILGLNPGGSWKLCINNGTIVELEKTPMGFVIEQILQVKHDEGEE